jgi:lipopolysaccharide transport system permease protein
MKLRLSRKISLALEDLIAASKAWHVWYILGISELRQRYRRSTIGPFWVTISMAVQALVMGFVLSFLFKTDVTRYLPFICISLIVWNFFSNSIIEGSSSLISMSGVILQIKRPYSVYIMLVLWRNALIFAHTVIVFFIAAVIFKMYPNFTYFFVPFGLGLFLLNVSWMVLAAALLSARFRDVPLMIQNAFSILVWLTPVYYLPEQLGPRARMIIELNPLTYVIEVARGPFLNQPPSETAWLVSLGLAVAGWVITFALFVRTRSRIAYWL